MLVEFLSTLFFIFNILLIILVVMQKNHGGFWSGPAGNDSVNIFGGNQGADVLQKITWIFGAILIFGCLFLSVYQASQSQISQFYLSEVKEEIINKTKTENITEQTNENKNNTLANPIEEINNINQLEKKNIESTNVETKITEKSSNLKESNSIKKDLKKKTVLSNKQKK